MGDSPMARVSGIFKQKKVLSLGLLFLLGVVLLLFSGSRGETSETALVSREFDEAAYTQMLEERVAALISAVQGAGETRVMLTMETFFIEHYALDRTKSTHVGSGGEEECEEESTVVLETGKNGVKTPIVQSVSLPRVRGVSVVCTGGSEPAVQMKIITLVQTLFDLNANQISVTN
ncbi:MAG: hypothetical protein IJF24_01705 [Clostridia bacterium]|nr:hypothetical protein [Clostridia bacterium]